MARIYVLDASALLHFIDDDSGAARVERLIKDARDTTPVSYTHLDVYKRQILE